ncbi:MAG: radical SAM protein [Candidatus Omnitrophica bacterium]|nr:radical SAM protein [Candidatus Omnitrophota bacterium]
MRVLLINPPVLNFRRGKDILPVINNLFFNSPPLGIGYIAAVLESEGISVAIIDAAVERLTISELIDRVEKFEPDVIGITATTNLFDSAVETARKLKEIFVQEKIVIGGPHVSANPQHALSFKCFDVGIKGEGEITFLELVRALKRNGPLEGISGLILRRENQIFLTPARALISDLDSLPFPARHLLPMGRYLPQPNDQYRLPKVSMITSRGCPYSCIFCDKSIFSNRYRSFSPAYIVSEMEQLIERYGARDIAFLDSTFTVSKSRVEGIIDEMKRRKVKVNWTCTVRADVVTKELLIKMKETGCWRIRLGVESGDEEVLKFIKKGITIQQVVNVANWAHQIGLRPKGFFMIGHAVDTKESIEKTIRFAKTLPLKDITVQMNTPMKNTAQYKIFDQFGSIAADDYNKFSYWEPIFIPNGLDKEYLLETLHRFYRSFYLRPIILWRHLTQIRSLDEVVKYLRSLKLIYFLLFHKCWYWLRGKK